ncbi:deoxyhypusine synthase family protein [Nanoarchaeota archaeon]
MEYSKDILWQKDIKIKDFVKQLGKVGYQSIELRRASEAIAKMKREGAKIFLTFTSNLATSGLRGLFAQLIKLKMVNVIVTGIGSIEEDIMKSMGEKFIISSFNTDDVSNYEKGLNRIGNLMISNESYGKFEDKINSMLKILYEKKKKWTISELMKEIGLLIEDENSILYQAAKNDIPIFCPAVTDGAFGFHLYLFKQKHPDFELDSILDFKRLLDEYVNQDDQKGLISLGGGFAKHHAILTAMLSGGLDYAVYITSDTPVFGSLSGATTEEAKSWGKIKDDTDAATVVGDATIIFPLVIFNTLDILTEEGFIE